MVGKKRFFFIFLIQFSFTSLSVLSFLVFFSDSLGSGFSFLIFFCLICCREFTFRSCKKLKHKSLSKFVASVVNVFHMVEKRSYLPLWLSEYFCPSSKYSKSTQFLKISLFTHISFSFSKLELLTHPRSMSDSSLV